MTDKVILLERKKSLSSPVVKLKLTLLYFRPTPPEIAFTLKSGNSERDRNGWQRFTSFLFPAMLLREGRTDLASGRNEFLDENQTSLSLKWNSTTHQTYETDKLSSERQEKMNSELCLFNKRTFIEYGLG